MIELSLGEIDVLVLKAYRGAGFSWGMAEEAGRASAWLARNGLPAAAFVDSLLKQIDGEDPSLLTPSVKSGSWYPSGNPLCPVISGTALSDTGLLTLSKDPIQLGIVYSPGLLLPFISACASAACINIDLQSSSHSISMTKHGTLKAGDFAFLSVDRADVILSTSSVAEASITSHTESHRRVPVSEEVFERLAKFAHRTYVPASEQSRTSGAGAGVTDND